MGQPSGGDRPDPEVAASKNWRRATTRKNKTVRKSKKDNRGTRGSALPGGCGGREHCARHDAKGTKRDAMDHDAEVPTDDGGYDAGREGEPRRSLAEDMRRETEAYTALCLLGLVAIKALFDVKPPPKEPRAPPDVRARDPKLWQLPDESDADAVLKFKRRHLFALRHYEIQGERLDRYYTLNDSVEDILYGHEAVLIQMYMRQKRKEASRTQS